MEDNQKLLNALKAIMAYWNITMDEALYILMQEDRMETNLAYELGYYNAVTEVSMEMSWRKNEAKKKLDAVGSDCVDSQNSGDDDNHHCSVDGQ